MRDLALFATKAEYEAFVWGEIFRDPVFGKGFYRNLIQFVLDGKAPVFYRQSDPSEHANFSAYYNFVLRREGYDSPTFESMYFLHDFAHMLFYYPHDMSAVTRDEFDEAMITGEYAASNETEILLHYRLPEVRARVLRDRRIFYDVLADRGVPQPSARSMLAVRRLLVETDLLDPFFFVAPEDQPVRATLKGYRGNNAWCKARMAETLQLENPTEYFYRFLTPANYERVLAGYVSTAGQADYERTVLRNVRLAFELLGLPDPPESFGAALEAAQQLEGRVLVKSIRVEDPA